MRYWPYVNWLCQDMNDWVWLSQTGNGPMRLFRELMYFNPICWRLHRFYHIWREVLHIFLICWLQAGGTIRSGHWRIFIYVCFFVNTLVTLQIKCLWMERQMPLIFIPTNPSSRRVVVKMGFWGAVFTNLASLCCFKNYRMRRTGHRNVLLCLLEGHLSV